MLHRLRQAIADDFLSQKAHGPEDVAAAQVAFWTLLRSPYFNGNHEQLKFVQFGPLAFSLEVESSGNQVRLDPLEYFYPSDWDEPDTRAFRVPFPQHTHDPVAVESLEAIAPSIVSKAQSMVDRLIALEPRFQKLVKPSSEGMAQRRSVGIELLDREGLEERLTVVLGEGHGSSLRAEGIRYHSPGWSDGADWRYLLAHNGEEVAGVLGFYAKESSLVLSYVSVAPGFRKEGLSMRLYERLLEICQAEQRFLVRSSPGEFTKANPAITQAYNRLLRESPVLHITAGGYLHKAIQDGLDAVGMPQLFPLAKPVCDLRTTLDFKGFEGDRWESEKALELRSAWADLQPSPKPRAPRP